MDIMEITAILREKLMVYWSALSELLENKTLEQSSLDVIFEDLISCIDKIEHDTKTKKVK